MYTKSMLAKKRVSFYRLLVDLEQPDAVISPVSQYDVPESRATRLVGDSNRFMTVSFSKKSQDRYIRPWLEDLTLPGKSIEYDDVKYTFLGFTENHLKAGHLLFFREGVDFTVDELKEEFGDLKAVYNTSGYGKYAARLGLSFSSTVAAEEIELKDRKLLDDLRAEDGSLTSDGCGLIRDSYAQEVSRVLGIPPDTAVYQIRLGGIKGVLTRCPDDVFDTLCGCRGKKIAYRSSMVKYNNGSRILEVQNVSKAPKCGRLNKQFIVLLLTLGIPLSVFEDLLQVQLEQIAQMVTNREKALACVDGDVDAEGNGFHQELYEMLLAGHDMNEPYLACLLHRFQKASLDALREKLNIPVTGSGNVYGVVDHCDVLAEGEVYINLPGKGGPQVGPVAMMRNPAYDPNGTRVLEAVNRPALSHLTNCIVFSAKGAHSETDRMGGGDLDGDLYFFVFDPALIPKPDHLRLAPPPTSTTKKPALRKKTLKIAGRTPASSRRTAQCDMRTAAIDTFLSMRCNFHLGALANEWMARVGSTPALADSPDCKTLLPMIEAALDMVKSGENIALLKYEFNAFKSARPQTTAASGWKDPLVQLARLVPPAPRAELTDFTCDPQLVLQAETPDVYAEMVRDAKVVMRAYNTSLCIAIEADRAAKEQGWQEDEKRADLVKAAIVAQHFPAVENVLLDVPKYMLKASVWYFTGYENKKQAFAWLGSRWLNYIKALQSGHVPISVGVRSTALAGAPAALPSMPTRVRGGVRTPPMRSSPQHHQVCTPVQLPTPRSSPPSPLSDTESDTDLNDSDEGFELLDKARIYDTPVEELVPAAAALRIDTTTNTHQYPPPARGPVLGRTATDETLVNPSSESEVEVLPKPRTHTRAQPVSPSPARDTSARPRTRAQARALEPTVDVRITTSRPRTRAQARGLPDPEPEPIQTRSRTARTPAHTHSFRIQSHAAGSPHVYACACGVQCAQWQRRRVV